MSITLHTNIMQVPINAPINVQINVDNQSIVICMTNYILYTIVYVALYASFVGFHNYNDNCI